MEDMTVWLGAAENASTPFGCLDPVGTIQIKVVEQYFPVALFIMLYKVVLTFEPVDKILKCIEQYFPVVLFIVLYKVVLTFESVDEILKCA